MEESTRNQRSNAMNPYQGESTKALCVCSAGLLRSPTIAKYLTSLGYNTRACGTSQDYALIRLSSALLGWCDEVHVVKEQERSVRYALKQLDFTLPPEVIVLDIPDMYKTFAPELEQMIEDFYNSKETK